MPAACYGGGEARVLAPFGARRLPAVEAAGGRARRRFDVVAPDLPGWGESRCRPSRSRSSTSSPGSCPARSSATRSAAGSRSAPRSPTRSSFERLVLVAAGLPTGTGRRDARRYWARRGGGVRARRPRRGDRGEPRVLGRPRASRRGAAAAGRALEVQRDEEPEVHLARVAAALVAPCRRSSSSATDDQSDFLAIAGTSRRGDPRRASSRCRGRGPSGRHRPARRAERAATRFLDRTASPRGARPGRRRPSRRTRRSVRHAEREPGVGVDPEERAAAAEVPERRAASCARRSSAATSRRAARARAPSRSDPGGRSRAALRRAPGTAPRAPRRASRGAIRAARAAPARARAGRRSSPRRPSRPSRRARCRSPAHTCAKYSANGISARSATQLAATSKP